MRFQRQPGLHETSQKTSKQEMVLIKPSLSPESLSKSPPSFRKIRWPRVSVPQRKMYLAQSGCSEGGPTEEEVCATLCSTNLTVDLSHIHPAASVL